MRRGRAKESGEGVGHAAKRRRREIGALRPDSVEETADAARRVSLEILRSIHAGGTVRLVPHQPFAVA